MKYKRSLYVTLVLCLGMGTSMISQKPKTMKEAILQDEKAVLQAVETMTKSFNGKDIEGVMSSYHEGALVIFEPETPVRDHKTLKQMFLAAFAINPQFEYPNGHEVFVNGDTATHIAPWVMNGTAPDGTVVQQTGLSVSHLERQTDGKWLLTFDNPHGSYLLTK
nr:DUF4440 domain-containing protein [Allomuricauda sp.]